MDSKNAAVVTMMYSRCGNNMDWELNQPVMREDDLLATVSTSWLLYYEVS